LPEPAFEAPITGAIWHFARTLAFASKNQAPAAKSEHARFIKDSESLPRNIEFGNSDSGALIAVARPYLEGRLALTRNDVAAAIAALRRAVVAEDALAHDDPPGWWLSSRQALGAALLQAGDFGNAEKVYRDDLERNPENGRALLGLQSALAGQSRQREAESLQQRIDRAWRTADTTPAAAI
jgi:tetratricopeptide (TPR) repeat protein